MKGKKKILLFLQLFFTCGYLFWLISKPLLKEVFIQREGEYLFATVVGKNEFFHHLPLDQQEKIEKGLQERKHREGFNYSAELFHVLCEETSPFGLAWVTFSFLFCLSLYLPVKKMPRAAYLLPLLVIGYTCSLKKPTESQEHAIFFPLEEELIAHYLDNPMQWSFRDKKKDLLRAWHYIVKGHEQKGTYVSPQWPTPEEEAFKERVERGLFALNIARIECILEKQGKDDVVESLFGPPSFFSCLLFLTWNSLFAIIINRNRDGNLRPQ